MYIFDKRGGCVAVYEAPERNCLSLPMSAFTFYNHGKYSPVSGWNVPAWRVREAQIVCEWLNSSRPTKRAGGRAYAALHMLGIAISVYFTGLYYSKLARR